MGEGKSGVLIPRTQRMLPLLVALGLGLVGVDTSLNVRPAIAKATSKVALKVRRYPGRVDVVVSGVGPTARVVSQRTTSSLWTGHIQGVVEAIELEQPQRLALPDVGLSSIRLASSGSGYELTVRTSSDSGLDAPTVTSDGTGVIVSFKRQNSTVVRSSARLDLSRPGRVNQSVYAPPMRARASAPPLGDIAVGSMLLNNRSYVQASGPSVSLTLNNALAKDALMSLARLGGYGFVYVNEPDPDSTKTSSAGVTMAFRDERFDRALNSVLLASGLQAKLEGRTLMVGTSVSSKTFGPQMSKVFRLNQVKVDKAADYLASLGASMNVINTITTTTGEPSSAGTSQLSNQASRTTQKTTKVETYGASVGPLIGLTGTTDTRLGTVTLVGAPQLITSAESYLKQLDLRRRQVAVKVQILNVNLENDRFLDSSFSARMGDTFIVSDSGKGHLNFGQTKPGGPAGSGTYGQGASGVPGTYSSYGQVPQQSVIDPMVASQAVVNPVVEEQIVFPPQTPGEAPVLVPKLDAMGRPIYVPSSDPTASQTLKPVYDSNGQPIYVPSSDPAASQTLKPVYDSNGQPIYVPSSDPAASQTLKPVYDEKGRVKYVPSSDQYRQPDNSFYAYIEAQIVARNAKTLAQPTLLVQEGQKAFVETGSDVVVNVEKTDGDDNNLPTFTYEKENAGLTLEVEVDKIDDNGFVTMNVNPSVSVPVPADQVIGVDTGGVQIFNLNKRDLKSGSIRLRDGQTLIVTGVVNEQQIEEVNKWPILGDLPLIGSLFRSSESTRSKEELVILVTPRVLDDDQGGVFGYGYRPATQSATQLIQNGL